MSGAGMIAILPRRVRPAQSAEAKLREIRRELDEFRADYALAAQVFEERIAALSAAVGMTGEWPAPPSWGLARQERMLLSALASHGVCSADLLIDALYWNSREGPNDPKGVVHVRIAHLRRKLRPFGVSITTHRGAGYELCETGRRLLREART